MILAKVKSDWCLLDKYPRYPHHLYFAENEIPAHTRSLQIASDYLRVAWYTHALERPNLE